MLKPFNVFKYVHARFGDVWLSCFGTRAKSDLGNVCIGYHMRGEVISILLLEGRYHFVSLHTVEARGQKRVNLFVATRCLY